MKNVAELQRFLEENDLELSRTAKSGTADNSISSLKRPALVTGRELVEAVARNRLTVARFILAQSPYRPTSPLEPTGALLALAFLTNDGIAPNGLFRLWNYEPQVRASSAERVEPKDIPENLGGIGSRLFEALRISSEREKLAIVGEIEWDIGIGPLHPFYDGCGRISRYFSALSSLWLDVPMVHHTSRKEYMERASEGRREFIDYYLRQQQRPSGLSD